MLLRKLLFAFTFLISSFLSWAQTATAPASGDGSLNNPYQIANLENLYWISQNSSEWGKHFLQTADIDASPTSAWSGSGWIPIGTGTTTTTAFTGTYDGGGFYIDGLFFNVGLTTNGQRGLFGEALGATFVNIELRNVNFTGGARLGGVVGRAQGNSKIFYCRVISGSIAGEGVDGNFTASVGGIVGLLLEGTMQNSFVGSGLTVSGTNRVGGIAGAIFGATTNRGLLRASKSEASVAGRRTNTSANGLAQVAA
jgi:hypothetical protein